ncbi:MAG: hypothetical protein CM1200mP26_23990 [Acidimicrobiales bacterium]|nr:MAG: hypothetical protein CM1200mP26_23990 [Acidimicrobiales bacterium]
MEDVVVEVRNLKKLSSAPMALWSKLSTMFRFQFDLVSALCFSAQVVVEKLRSFVRSPDSRSRRMERFPLHGERMFSGKKKLEVAPQDRALSMIFQSYALWPQ